jgi:hypothetical protein
VQVEFLRAEAMDMIIPPVQYPHWTAPALAYLCCMVFASSGPSSAGRPSTVKRCRPPHANSGRRQEFRGNTDPGVGTAADPWTLFSTWHTTVHAPHPPSPHASLVPVSCCECNHSTNSCLEWVTRASTSFPFSQKRTEAEASSLMLTEAMAGRSGLIRLKCHWSAIAICTHGIVNEPFVCSNKPGTKFYLSLWVVVLSR